MRRIAIRIFQGGLTVIGLVVLIFLLVRLVPGDPAIVFAGEQSTAEELNQIRVTMGLDKPLYIQLGLYLERLAVGDLGKSVRTHLPVWNEIASRAGRTALLASLAILLGLVVGVALAIVATRYPGSIVDRIISILVVIGYSTPLFWIALVLIDLLGVRLKIIPTGGYGDWKHFILPVFVLAFYLMGPISQLTRGSLNEVMNQEFIWMARAKGVPENFILYQHALRNAILPTVAYLGTQAGLLFGGAAIVETVFAWHGLGMLIVTASLSRDYPLVQGTVLVIGISFTVINSLIEYIYELIDPRIAKRQ